VFLHRLFVELIGLSLLDGDGIHGTVSEAGAQSIAQVIGEQPGLAVDDLDRAFGTGRNTKAAAVAFFLIYFYDLSFHRKDSNPSEAKKSYLLILFKFAAPAIGAEGTKSGEDGRQPGGGEKSAENG
jgi:hypothetical protein